MNTDTLVSCRAAGGGGTLAQMNSLFSQMNSLLWIVALIAMVWAVVQTLSVAVAGTSRKDWLDVGVGTVLSLGLLATPLARLWWLTAILALAIGFGAAFRLKAVTRNAVHAGRIRTLSATHFALLAGSFGKGHDTPSIGQSTSAPAARHCR